MASHENLISDANRALLNKNNPPFAQVRANELIPIYMGSSTTAGSTKALTVTGILATDIVLAIATSAAGVINDAACTANTITVNASAAVVPFSFVVFRPTAPA